MHGEGEEAEAVEQPALTRYWNGKYNVFFQYNPSAAVWGDMHWAHAMSQDMIHWKHLPAHEFEHFCLFCNFPSLQTDSAI